MLCYAFPIFSHPQERKAMKALLCLFLSLYLTACTTHTQTTSGQSYLDKYKNVPTLATTNEDNINIEAQIRQAAQVEPILSFPARIGLARIDNGRLSNIPGEEIEAWIKTRDKLGKDFGEFIPLSPLVTNMVSSSVESQNNSRINNVINKIRLGAARQHLDAVLIYETYSKSDRQSNFLSIANITIIGGYILPSKAIEAEGFANAMLIDVIQGYPYGTAEVILDKEEMYTSSWGSQERQHKFSEKVKTKAAIKLAGEAERMFMLLRAELAEKRIK